jgi:hypothetical protein
VRRWAAKLLHPSHTAKPFAVTFGSLRTWSDGLQATIIAVLNLAAGLLLPGIHLQQATLHRFPGRAGTRKAAWALPPHGGARQPPLTHSSPLEVSRGFFALSRVRVTLPAAS